VLFRSGSLEGSLGSPRRKNVQKLQGVHVLA
jgi:hypothetical protein